MRQPSLPLACFLLQVILKKRREKEKKKERLCRKLVGLID